MAKEPNSSTASDIAPGKAEYIWKGPLYKKTSLPALYYVLLIIIGLVLGGVFYWLNQPLSIIVVATALLFFLTHATEVPKALRHTVNSDGLGIEEKFYEYDRLKSFWVADHAVGLTLYVERLERLSFPLSIPLERANALAIRNLLRQHLPESKSRGELFIDIINRITGLS